MVSKVLITGSTGFIGSALSKKMPDAIKLEDDIRYEINIDERARYVFHFAAPPSQVLFQCNPEHCINVTINGFLRVIEYCRQTGAKLIYPSTGLLSMGATNEYAMCKHLTEKIAEKSGIETLGVRIFAGYGPGEEHKRDYKSVIGLFLDEMIHDRQPVIYGDGNQRRDFVYINDIVDNILEMAETKTGIQEIGSGISWSFNEIVEVINKVLGKDIKPIYIDKPGNYVNETVCEHPIKNHTPLEEGIRKYVESYNLHHNS
jgi:UDP-glucose 4-epimerase